ncbi:MULTISPECIES: GGDEF domain-containing protein [unclassified Sphingomonas]|uniref:GGDEF domain-containing protein n=1 Tax=unclassified Sphingomonas TaxID=196159 RepID=UPI00226A12C6
METSLVEAATGAGYEALQFLTQQRLEHTPANFALAWHLKTDRRGMTAMAVDAILMEGRPLTQSDVDRIMIAEARRGKGDEEADPRQDALRHQTLRLADLAAGAATQSSEFGRDLSADLFHLSGGAGSVEQIVKAMVQRTRGVEAQLNAASREIEDLRQQVEVTRDDAQRDALTGLLNRRGATQELTARRKADPGVVALCDIDHFKSVNDQFGHSVGDRVLKAVAGSLSDSVGAHTVARWGGEEFLIIFDGLRLEDAAGILERTRKDLEAKSFKIRNSDETLGTITISIGAASLAGIKRDDAIEAADRMLYEAKRQGRNRIVMRTRGVI